MLEHTEEEQRICNLLEEGLKKFPLYNSEEDITVKKTDRAVHISHPPLYNHKERLEKIHLDLQIEDKICYLMFMHIEKEKQRQGYGTKLYQCIENFCKKMNVNKIMTNPAGKGSLEFILSLGFENKTEKGTFHKNYVKELKN